MARHFYLSQSPLLRIAFQLRNFFSAFKVMFSALQKTIRRWLSLSWNDDDDDEMILISIIVITRNNETLLVLPPPSSSVASVSSSYLTFSSSQLYPFSQCNLLANVRAKLWRVFFHQLHHQQYIFFHTRTWLECLSGSSTAAPLYFWFQILISNLIS